MSDPKEPTAEQVESVEDTASGVETETANPDTVLEEESLEDDLEEEDEEDEEDEDEDEEEEGDDLDEDEEDSEA